jgi:DNA-binding transcriptional regulator YiaG
MTMVICPGCGRPTASERVLPEYHYQESGLENLWLAGGVTETTCPECGETFIGISKEWQLLQVIAVGLLTEPYPLKGSELRFLRQSCELSQSGLAAVLDCRRETIAEREARRAPGLSFAEETGLRLILLKSLRAHLAKPGNRFLAPSQFRQLRDLAGFLDRLATKTESNRGRNRIDAELKQELWMWKETGRAA